MFIFLSIFLSGGIFIKNFFIHYILFFIILLFFSIFSSVSTIFLENENLSNVTYSTFSNKLIWPIPSSHRITSYFGKRNAPTKGSSSNHSGIDIAAPEGTPFLAVISGSVSFTGFKGAGGYTITIKNSDYEVSYCHTSNNYLFNVGDTVLKGEILGQVGPKYITPISNNKYTDSSGRQTNGATTGCHLHFSIKINEKFVNPLDYIEI